MGLGLILLLSAGLWSYLNWSEEERAAESVETAVEKLESIIPQLEPEQTETEASDETAANELLTQETVIETPEMQTMEIDGNSYIGVLEIPSLQLTLSVMSDWSYPQLKISPCRYSGSYLDDTLVIAGHSYRRHFRLLRQIEVGDSVLFTDAVGNVIHYEVVQVETLGPKEVDRLIHSEWDLTLFSCTSGGSHRVTVRCNRV